DVLVGVAELAEGQLEAVEHREQLLDHRLVGAADGVGLLPQHPLPVVLEVGLYPLREPPHLVALPGDRGEIGVQVRLRRLGGGLGGGVLVDRFRLGHHALRSSPSSTISASATSSSDGCEAPPPAGPVPAPASPLACWACAAWYRRCANSWLAVRSASCFWRT